jgi:hypothetical protein
VHHADKGFLAVDLARLKHRDVGGAAWATGINASRDGTSAQVTLSTAVMRMAASQSDRKVGIKFTAAAATKAAGQVGLTLLYRAV